LLALVTANPGPALFQRSERQRASLGLRDPPAETDMKSQPRRKSTNTAEALTRVKLTAADSETTIEVVDADDGLKFFVNHQMVDGIKQAAMVADVPEEELVEQIVMRGLPARDVEARMLADYALEYFVAAALLSHKLGFRLPTLFNLGHAYELALKGAIVLQGRSPLDQQLRDLNGHDLRKLRQLAVGGAHGPAIDCCDKAAVGLFDIYFKKREGRNLFFSRYPDRRHLGGKWPDGIVEAVDHVAGETEAIIRWLHGQFRDRGWGYRAWPAEAPGWSPLSPRSR
jgi:hypothetical protein